MLDVSNSAVKLLAENTDLKVSPDDIIVLTILLTRLLHNIRTDSTMKRQPSGIYRKFTQL